MKKRVNISIEEHVLTKVDEMAKQRGIDRSTMISILIYDATQIIEIRHSDDTDNEDLISASWRLGNVYSSVNEY